MPWLTLDTSRRSSTKPHEMRELSVHHVADLFRVRRGWRRPQNIQPIADRRERIAQLMGERCEKLVLAPVRLRQRLGVGLQFVALSGDLMALLVELEEHTGLAAQDVRLDRLVEEVDRAGLVAAKSALAIGALRP